MPKISSYALEVTPTVEDKLIGTDVASTGAPNPTRNFKIQALINLTLKNGVFAGTYALPSYDDDTAAGAAGLVTGQLFQTAGGAAAPLNAAGIVMVKQ